MKAFPSSLRFKFKIKVVIENSFKMILSEEVNMKCIKCLFRNAERLCINAGLSKASPTLFCYFFFFFLPALCLPFLISKYIMNLGSAGRQEMKGVAI